MNFMDLTSFQRRAALSAIQYRRDGLEELRKRMINNLCQMDHIAAAEREIRPLEEVEPIIRSSV